MKYKEDSTSSHWSNLLNGRLWITTKKNIRHSKNQKIIIKSNKLGIHQIQRCNVKLGLWRKAVASSVVNWLQKPIKFVE